MAYTSPYGPSSLSGGLAADAQSLGNLKAAAGASSPEAIKETAKQFESLFMRELMKSMRDATMKSGMLDNPGSDLGTDMLDQQFAVQMSGQPGGLGEMIELQLTRQMAAMNIASEPGLGASSSQSPTVAPNAAPTAATVTPISKTTRAPAALSAPSLDPARNVAKPQRPPTSNQVEFVNKHSDAASKIEKASGIPASYMLGQAGHETGWGKFEIKQKGGAPSFNLFGIKASAGWTGKVAEVTTTEYVNGVAEKKVAKFRAYDSYEDSFKDYARMISDSPRYAKVKAQTGSAHAFASGLQKAGYATDPDYAAKLSRAINTTLQLRRVQV